MMNPLGLCRFYPMDPSSLSTLLLPKPPTTKEHLKCLLVLAKAKCRPYIIVVFQGGPITPLGLMQELHMCHMLVHVIQSSYLTKPRMGTRHGYPLAHSAHIPSKMIRRTSTTLSRAHYHVSLACLGHASTCHHHIRSTAEETPF